MWLTFLGLVWVAAPSRCVLCGLIDEEFCLAPFARADVKRASTNPRLEKRPMATAEHRKREQAPRTPYAAAPFQRLRSSRKRLGVRPACRRFPNPNGSSEMEVRRWEMELQTSNFRLLSPIRAPNSNLLTSIFDLCKLFEDKRVEHRKKTEISPCLRPARWRKFWLVLV